MATKANVKQEAKRLIDELPDDATWDDAMYKLYVRPSSRASPTAAPGARWM